MIGSLSPPSPVGVRNIWDIPETAHTYDDEFDSTTLNGAWSLVAGAMSTGINPYATLTSGDLKYELHTNYRRSWLMLQPPTSASFHLQKSVTLATNQFIWVRGSFTTRLGTSPTNNDFTFGLTLSTSTYDETNRVSFYLNECDGTIIQAEFLKKVAGVVTSVGVTVDKYVSQADSQDIQAIGIQKISTTYHGWAFLGNGSAIYIGNTTFSPTVGQAILEVTNAVTTSPGNMIMGFDFIRFVDSVVFLP